MPPINIERLAGWFAGAGKPVAVSLVPHVNHRGIILQPSALQAVAAVCQL